VTAVVKQLGRWILTFSWCPVSVPSDFREGKPKESAWCGWLAECRIFTCSTAAPNPHNQRKRVMKTIRRLSTRLVLETEAGLVFQWMWYRLDRRQDTSELEHSLGSRDALRLEPRLQTIKQKMRHRRHIFLTYCVERRGRIEPVEQGV